MIIGWHLHSAAPGSSSSLETQLIFVIMPHPHLRSTSRPPLSPFVAFYPMLRLRIPRVTFPVPSKKREFNEISCNHDIGKVLISFFSSSSSSSSSLVSSLSLFTTSGWEVDRRITKKDCAEVYVNFFDSINRWKKIFILSRRIFILTTNTIQRHLRLLAKDEKSFPAVLRCRRMKIRVIRKIPRKDFPWKKKPNASPIILCVYVTQILD